MSGGSHNYIYSSLSQECEGEMHDDEMDDLIKDLCDVLHDLEWWQSGDYSEDKYRETVSEFKKKWFKGERNKISKCCPWHDMCIYKTATCRVRYPDNGCVLYRWFKELISKEDEDESNSNDN